jgi:hypothetical protein
VVVVKSSYSALNPSFPRRECVKKSVLNLRSANFPFVVPAKAGTHRSAAPDFSSNGNPLSVLEGSCAGLMGPGLRRGDEQVAALSRYPHALAKRESSAAGSWGWPPWIPVSAAFGYNSLVRHLDIDAARSFALTLQSCGHHGNAFTYMTQFPVISPPLKSEGFRGQGRSATCISRVLSGGPEARASVVVSSGDENGANQRNCVALRLSRDPK